MHTYPDPINNSVRDEQILYAFEYYLNSDNANTGGSVVITPSRLLAYDPHAGLREWELTALSEFKCVLNVGCVSFECTRGGEGMQICRSDMRSNPEFLDIASQLNHYLKERSYRFNDEAKQARICTKCGRPFAPGSDICPHCIDRGQVIRRLLAFAKPHWLSLSISALIFLAVSLIQLLLPYLERQLIDNYITNEQYHNRVAEIFIRDGKFTVLAEFLTVVVMIALSDLAVNVIGAARSLLMTRTSTKISVQMRSMVYAKVQQMSLSRISKRTTGEIMNRVTGDTDNLQGFITFDIPYVFQQVVILVAVVIYLVITQPMLSVLVLLPAPLAVFAVYSIWKYLRNLYHKQWDVNSKASTILHDILSGIRVVKVFGMEKREVARYNKAIKEMADVSERNEVTYNIFNPVINFLMSMGNFFVLYFVGRQIINHTMTLGEMNQFVQYVGIIYGPLYMASYIPRMIARVLTSAAKIFELLDEKVDVQNAVNASVRDIDGNISFENVFFGYKEHELVLRDINLDIKPGEMIGIVGRSGVGKSTLINLVMRLYDVNSGCVKVDGEDIRRYDQDCLRSQIGVVLQENFLFTGSVYDNIAYAKQEATRDEVIRAAKLANAHQFIMKLPDGYNTKIGERGHNLSGGERQRIAIARSILHNPRILILDEATASLDTETESLIQEALQKLIKDRTTLAIAHRLSTLRNATRLVVLDKGMVAEVGTHDELVRKKGIYYELVMAQRQMFKIAK